MADGNEYNLFQLKEKGEPVEIGLPHRRHAADHRPERACSRMRPTRTRRDCSAELHVLAGVPAADRRCRRPALLASAGTRKRQAASRSSDIKLMKDDPAAVEKTSDQIKAHYVKIFQVCNSVEPPPDRRGEALSGSTRETACSMTAVALQPHATARPAARLRSLEAGAARFRGDPVRADRPAAVLAGLSSPSPTQAAPSRSPISHRCSPTRPSSTRCSPPSIIATSSALDLLRGGRADGLAGGAHRYAAAGARSALLVMASFVTPPFLGAIAWELLAAPNSGLLNQLYRELTGAGHGLAPVQHLQLHRADLRHLLLHLSLRLRAGRQCARPHAGRSRGRLRHARRRGAGTRRAASPFRWRCRRCSRARWSPSCRP